MVRERLPSLHAGDGRSTDKLQSLGEPDTKSEKILAVSSPVRGRRELRRVALLAEGRVRRVSWATIHLERPPTTDVAHSQETNAVSTPADPFAARRAAMRE